mmetsp:Transcript_621/g.2452  ORF Transcript_621/g.2452 Transcript_621/m.2452 type:complete len:557 (-) Transcript_621:16-1686(-)
MRRRERPALRRAVDDDEGGAELDAVAARRRDGGELDAHRRHDLVAVGREADDDAGAAEGEDPGHVVLEVVLLLDLALLPRDVRRGEGAHGVGNVVRAVRERVDHRREDLDVAEEALGLGVVARRVRVHVADDRVLAEHGVRVLVELARDVADGARRLRLGRGDGQRLRRAVLDREFDVVDLALLDLGVLGEILLDVVVVLDRLGARLVGALGLDPLGDGDEEEERDAEAARGDDGGDLDRRGEGAVLRLAHVAVRAEPLRAALGALDDPERRVDARREGDDEREEDAREEVRALLDEDAVLGDGVEDGGADTRGDGREEPRDGDLGDAVEPGELVEAHVRVAVAVVLLGVVPHDAVLAARHEGHADDAADRRVRRRHGHFEVRRDEEPDRDGEDDAGHAVDEEAGIVLEAADVGDALADRLRDGRAHEDRAAELEDRREEDCLLDRDRLGADRRRERVGDVVRADAVRGDEGEDAGRDDEPRPLLAVPVHAVAFGGEREERQDHEAARHRARGLEKVHGAGTVVARVLGFGGRCLIASLLRQGVARWTLVWLVGGP